MIELRAMVPNVCTKNSEVNNYMRGIGKKRDKKERSRQREKEERGNANSGQKTTFKRRKLQITCPIV